MNLSSWFVQVGQQVGWQNVAGVASSGANLLQVGYLQVGCRDETLHWLHVVCTDLSLGYLGGCVLALPISTLLLVLYVQGSVQEVEL